MISGWMPRSAWRPEHWPAAEDVRVDVTDCLAGARAGVKDDSVAVVSNALGDRHLMRMGNQVGQQPCLSGREFGHVCVMSTRNHKYVYRRLWVDIAERHCPRIGRDYRRGYLSGCYAAEQAVGHGPILTCGTSGARQADIVALLRSQGAPPLWCNGLASFWLRRSGMSHARALMRRLGCGCGGKCRT
jgi:hypothetical protein